MWHDEQIIDMRTEAREPSEEDIHCRAQGEMVMAGAGVREVEVMLESTQI